MHHWYPPKMTSEERLLKFHTGDVSLLRSGLCFWLAEENFPRFKTNQKHYPPTRHQYGISVPFSGTSFRAETNAGLAKFWPFSQTTSLVVTSRFWQLEKELHREPLGYNWKKGGENISQFCVLQVHFLKCGGIQCALNMLTRTDFLEHADVLTKR